MQSETELGGKIFTDAEKQNVGLGCQNIQGVGGNFFDMVTWQKNLVNWGSKKKLRVGGKIMGEGAKIYWGMGSPKN